MAQIRNSKPEGRRKAEIRKPKIGRRQRREVAFVKTRSTGMGVGTHHRLVRISIVTPSYRRSAWLRLCIASVADQRVKVEHIVQDAESDDGTLDWLPREPKSL